MKTGSDQVTVRGIPVLIEVLHEREDRWSWRFSAANGVNGCNAPGDLAPSEVQAFDRALDAAYRAIASTG
ncbi:MAG TPA: hypothetical protein VGD76_04525 [Ramlibacter sp.]